MTTTAQAPQAPKSNFMKYALWTIVAVFVAIGMTACNVVTSAISVNNNYQQADEASNAAWSEVMNQLQRRSDLIPSIVATVQGEANFEKSTLQAVIEARASATGIRLTPEALKDPKAMEVFSKKQGDITTALSRLMMVTENYPNLKANAAFQDLRVQLEGTENRITVARNRYIQAIRVQNTPIRTFPNSIYAGFFGLQPRAQFTVDEAKVSQAPKVEFK